MISCIECSKESESSVGFIVFYEIYEEFIDRHGDLHPMGVFCGMRCVQIWSAKAVRLEIEAKKKKK